MQDSVRQASSLVGLVIGYTVAGVEGGPRVGFSPPQLEHLEHGIRKALTSSICVVPILFLLSQLFLLEINSDEMSVYIRL